VASQVFFQPTMCNLMNDLPVIEIVHIRLASHLV
jgi:hypothetical protein